jgi:hypothetical protein
MLVINFRSSECKSTHTNIVINSMSTLALWRSKIDNEHPNNMVINSMITLALWRSKIDNEHPHNIVINSMITLPFLSF